MNNTRILVMVALAATFAAGLFGGAWLFSDRAPMPSLTMADAEEAYERGDYAKTFEILLPLAKTGEPLAEYRVGMMLNSGTGVEQDVDEAIPWLRRAVTSNVSGAREVLGKMYVQKAENAESAADEISNYQRAADLGVAEAQAVLGSYFLAGQSVDRNYETALSYLELAAAQEDPKALTNLGFMYATGTGVARDDARAFGYYLQAAELGLVRAQAAAGLFLETGRGVDVDVVEAARWLLNAATAGNEPAAARLGGLIVDGTVMPPAEVSAANFVAAAAAGGNGDALDWLAQQAEEDDPIAAGRLAEIYLGGKGVDVDRERGLFFLRHAAAGGDEMSQLELSRRLGSGDGYEQDYVAAHLWANLAASTGNAEAIELRGIYANLMTPEQIDKAQALAREWTAARTDSTGDEDVQ